MKQANQQQLPIFILNLPEAKKRREVMQQQLDKHNLKGEFFKASRGDELPQEFLAKFDVEYFFKGYIRWKDLGCTLSHYLLLETIVAKEIPMAVILEDDAKFYQKLVNVIHNYKKLPMGWDILQLGYWIIRNLGKPFIFRKVYPLSLWYTQKVNIKDLTIDVGPLIDGVWQTHAYMITNDGAKRLLQTMEQWPLAPFDCFLCARRKQLRWYAVSPSLGFQDLTLPHSNLLIDSPKIKAKPILSPKPIRIKAMIYGAIKQKGHPLSVLYYSLRSFYDSIIKTIKILKPPIMRKS